MVVEDRRQIIMTRAKAIGKRKEGTIYKIKFFPLSSLFLDGRYTIYNRSFDLALSTSFDFSNSRFEKECYLLITYVYK